jgi:hypothetical protein
VRGKDNASDCKWTKSVREALIQEAGKHGSHPPHHHLMVVIIII